MLGLLQVVMGSLYLAVQLWWEVPSWVLAMALMSSRIRGVKKLRYDIDACARKSVSWGQLIMQFAVEIVLSEGGERCNKAMVILDASAKGTIESPWRRNRRSPIGGQRGMSVKAPPMALQGRNGFRLIVVGNEVVREIEGQKISFGLASLGWAREEGVAYGLWSIVTEGQPVGFVIKLLGRPWGVESLKGVKAFGESPL